MQSLKTQSLPQLAQFEGLDNNNAFLTDLNTTLDAVSKLLRIQTNASKTRQRLEERLAKAESNYSMSLTKIEKLEDSIREKEKTIGKLENSMHRERAMLKDEHLKKRTEEVAKEKGKAVKQLADKQYEHEIKKKDLEIAKLKDTLKKSAMSSKDKIEADAKWSKYEINNFYNGLESDFNMLDSKKTEIYRSHVEESTLLREIVMQFYSDLKDTLLDLFPRVEINSHLAWSILNKPMKIVKDSVLKCHKDLIHILRGSRNSNPPPVDRWEDKKEVNRYPEIQIEEHKVMSHGKWQKPDRAPLPKSPANRIESAPEVNRWAHPEPKRHFHTRSELLKDFQISGIDSPSPTNENSRLRSSSDIQMFHDSSHS